MYENFRDSESVLSLDNDTAYDAFYDARVEIATSLQIDEPALPCHHR